jgi:hypothetical protein
VNGGGVWWWMVVASGILLLFLLLVQGKEERLGHENEGWIKTKLRECDLQLQLQLLQTKLPFLNVVL